MRVLSILTLTAVALAGSSASVASDAPQTAPAVAEVETADGALTLTRVLPKKVCMVNDRVFERDQIPVIVEEKTYFGCCEMCKTRLAEDINSRRALDPVTGQKVDKAKAVIAAWPDGRVLYFESETTLAKFDPASAASAETTR